MQNVRVLAHDLLAEFNQIDSTMAESIAAAEGNFGTEAEIRTLLSAGLGAHPAVITSCYVDSKGILKYLEPAAYKDSEGADISMQAHTIAMLENPEPMISTAFKAVEGFAAVAMAQPLFDAEQKFVGSLVLTLDSSIFSQLVLSKNELGADYELWAMDPNGVIVSHQDKAKIGANILTDPMYLEQIALQNLAREIAAKPSGEGEYSINAAESQEDVSKKAYWNTIQIHAQQWRVVLAEKA